MNDTSNTAEHDPANHGLGPANSRRLRHTGRFLPETLVVAAMLFLGTVLILAFRSHRQDDDRGPLAEPGDMPSAETGGDTDGFPPPTGPAAPQETSHATEFGEFTPSPHTDSELDSHPLRKATGQNWREASEEEREAIAQLLARWLHATATAEEQQEFAAHYRSQLDLLSQQTDTGTGPLWDWLPLIHARLVANED